MRTKKLHTIFGTLALFTLMIALFVSCEKSRPVEDPQHFDLDVTFHTENIKDHSNKGFGLLKFRQDPDTARAFVRPWNTFGVRMRARIATCGPPRAALIVLDSGRGPALRAVPRAEARNASARSAS